jgi:hypothetical protein
MSWQVSLKTTNCDSCETSNKTLTLRFNSLKIVASGSHIVVNGRELGDDEGFSQDGFTIEHKDEFVYFKYSDGLRLKWSVDSLSVFVTVDHQYIDKVNGLCGDYDGNSNNDFLLPDRSRTKDSNFFGNSWRLDGFVSFFFYHKIKNKRKNIINFTMSNF